MRKRTLRILGLTALLIVRAPARVPAWAQFESPYDPDFAPQESPAQPAAPSEAPSPEAPPAEAAPGETPAPAPGILIPGIPVPFLLIDRPDPARLLERPAEELAPAGAAGALPAAAAFEEFEQGLEPFRYDTKRYQDVSAMIERGEEPGARGAVTPLISGEVPAISTAPAPKPAQPEVELPTYGTSLSVTGRKVIGFNFSEKRFLNSQAKTGRAATTNLFDIQQQLQLRMQGKVGPKITVNVDYDDTKLNKQDISVIYQGDPNEVVQNVSFGDIDLSLPATEFVSYNKQLFGIRADVKYKGLKSSLIASRTKGTTKSKQFFGNTQFVATDILDSAYVRRTYYDVSFGNNARLPIQPGSERVFLATQVLGQTNSNTQVITVNDLQVAGSSFTGTFIQLSPGLDYTIDYAKGIVTLRGAAQPQSVLAVDYLDAAGTSITLQTSSGSTVANGPSCIEPPGTANGPLLLPGQACPKLIKTPSDVPIASPIEVGFNRELKTIYSIGQTQIVRDNGRGNFILKVLDTNRVEVGPNLNPIQKYPETIDVDFENGIFRLVSPFAVVGDSATADPDIYAPTPISKHIIHVEYRFRFKTFILEANLVPQSEVVILDGVKLNRNVDFFIDYDAGFITFFNENRIQTNSVIDISYEVAPFANITNESLLGARVSYDFNTHAAIGSTLLYQAGAKSPTVPSVTELARSLLVYEADAQFKELRLGNKVKASFSGEFAQSRQDLNLNPFALIDNMEGIKQEDATSTLSQQWFIATNPGVTTLSGGSPSDPTHFSWFSEDIPVLQINPRSQATTQDSQKVLDLTYNNLAANEEVSIVFPFSAAGQDFSKKTVLEVVMLGDGSNNDFNIRLGGIGEDAEGTGGRTFTCADGSTRTGVPDTEDVNCDGILQPAEDVGWTYNPTTPVVLPSVVFGAQNGKIDTEDLNGNAIMDADDGNGNNFGYGLDLTGSNPENHTLFSLDSGSHTAVDFGPGAGWQTFQIPLRISSATAARWVNVKQVRLTIRRPAAGGLAGGTLKFARVAVVGNTWQPGAPTDPLSNSAPVNGENMVVTPVSSVDNPTYVPIFNAGGEATQVFNDLYGSLSNLQKQSNTKNLSEQALQLDFSSMTIVASTGAVVTTKRLFTRPIDVSQHRYFNFLVFGNADPANINTTDHTFFLRVGNDINFFEVQVPLNFIGWKKVRIRQVDVNGDSVMDTWAADSPGTVVVSTGAPSLQQVAEIVAGVRRTASVTAGADATQTRGRVFLNEIHLAEPVTRVGTAKKVEANFEIPGWATFGGKYREVDRNFQTPTSVVSNQDNRQDTSYLNFMRIRSFPMTFNLSRTITDTPSTFLTGGLSNLVNLLQTGRVTTWNGTAQGNFTLGAYPRVSLSHTRNRIEYDLLTRLDDRKTYSGTLQYAVPAPTRFLPRTIDGNYSYSQYDVSFDSLESRLLPGNFNTRETGETIGGRLTFVPWEGSAFNPSYNLNRIKESRSDLTTGAEKNSSYPKALTQNVGFTSNFRLTRWLNPAVSYQSDTIENNILNISTVVVSGSTVNYNVGDIKTVNRSANGNVSLPLTLAEMFPRSKLLRSMTIVSGYQVQDGDVWNNVDKGLNTQLDVWVRTPLHPGNPGALRQSQTLRDTFNSTQRWSPFEGYDIRGRLGSFKTFSISNNFQRSIQRSDTTGTQSKTITTTLPDIVANMGQLEQLLHSERWMSSTQLNFKYASRRSETVGQTIGTDYNAGMDLRTIIRRRYDTLVSYNQRSSINRNLLVQANTQTTRHRDATIQATFDIKKFRFTPKTEYSWDSTLLGTGVKSQDVTVVTPSLLVRADLALPKGLRLPGSARTLIFTNRVIWTSTLSYAWRRSPVTIADNSRLLSFSTSADYEIAKNLRVALNGAAQRLWHKFLKEEDFISYQLGTTLTFQF